MTLPITELLTAVNASSDNVPTFLMVIICVVLFFIAGGIGGIIAYKTKLKKLRENNKSPDDDNDTKE